MTNFPVIYQDIATASNGVIIHQVNCMGAMGSGIAASISRRYPAVKSEYLQFCSGKEPIDLLGQVQYIAIKEGLIVANLFGQLDFGRDISRKTDYFALKTGLTKISADYYKEELHIPRKIGAGLGGGNIAVIDSIFESVFNRAGNMEWKVKFYDIAA